MCEYIRYDIKLPDNVYSSPPRTKIILSAHNKPLNYDFVWERGLSASNFYVLEQNSDAITVVAGPNTDFWRSEVSAPSLLHQVSGNFVVSVKITANLSEIGHGAAIGIRSRENVNTFMRLSIFMEPKGRYIYFQSAETGSNSTANLVNYATYDNDTVQLRIERKGDLFTISYSKHDPEWIVLTRDYASRISFNAEIFLTPFSRSNQPISAQFSEFNITTI